MYTSLIAKMAYISHKFENYINLITKYLKICVNLVIQTFKLDRKNDSVLASETMVKN